MAQPSAERALVKDMVQSEIIIVEGWESQLVNDCRQIVFEAKLGVFKKWYELGRRMKADEEFLTKKYGDKWYVSLSEEIEVSPPSILSFCSVCRKIS